MLKSAQSQHLPYIVATMPDRLIGIERGLGLKWWYENFGFDEVGHRKK